LIDRARFGLQKIYQFDRFFESRLSYTEEKIRALRKRAKNQRFSYRRARRRQRTLSPPQHRAALAAKGENDDQAYFVGSLVDCIGFAQFPYIASCRR